MTMITTPFSFKLSPFPPHYYEIIRASLRIFVLQLSIILCLEENVYYDHELK